MMSDLDERFYRPSQDQLEKIVPKIDKETETIYNAIAEIKSLRNKVTDLEKEIERLKKEMIGIIL